MSKKDHGEGHISKRKDDTWTARIMVGHQQNGKPKIKAFYGKTEAEVKRKLKDFKKRGENLTKEETAKQSLTQYITHWLNVYKKPELKPRSFDTLETTINTHIIPKIGYIQIHNITANNIQPMLNEMQNKGSSFSTIKKVYDALNACMRHALVNEDISKNPMAVVSLPSKVNFTTKEIIFLKQDEVEKFYTEATRKYGNGRYIYRLGYALVLILYTGMRLGEALGLTWECIDRDNKTVTVYNNLQLIKNRSKGEDKRSYIPHDGKAKTKSGQGRVIPLNKRAYEAVEYLYSINAKEKYVVSSDEGNPTIPKNIFKTMLRIKERAGIERLNIHALRHTFASMLFAKGVDLKTVSELLGHSDIGITAKTYVHLLNEHKVHAVSVLD